MKPMMPSPIERAREVIAGIERQWLENSKGGPAEARFHPVPIVNVLVREHIAEALASAHAAGFAEALEMALKWVDAIHEGKDGSRDPAVVDNTCIRIRHAIRSLATAPTGEKEG